MVIQVTIGGVTVALTWPGHQAAVAWVAVAATVSVWLLPAASFAAVQIRIWSSPWKILIEVRKSLDSALGTPGPRSIAAAQKLYDTIQLYLGPVLELNGAASRIMGQLKSALDGKVKEEHVAHAISHSQVAPGPGAAVASVTGAAAAIVAVAPTDMTAAGHGPPAERPASTKEQVRQVREALEAFNDFWVVATAIPLLRRAQRAVLHGAAPWELVGWMLMRKLP
jgi:hypothetical protein